MKDPKYIVVKYIRLAEDGKHKAEFLRFAFDSELCLNDNIDVAIGSIGSFHTVLSIGSIVLKF